MVMLVGLNEAKAQLQVDHSDQDAHIRFLISAASGSVLNYLKRDLTDIDSDGELETDSEGVIVMEDEVSMAVLFLVGELFRNRDDGGSAGWSMGYLPPVVTALLYPLRDPALK